MSPQTLKNDLNAGFQTAATALFESQDWYRADDVHRRVLVRDLLAACAANAAQSIVDRAVSDEVADSLAEAGYTLNDAVARGMFVIADELQKKQQGTK